MICEERMSGLGVILKIGGLRRLGRGLLRHRYDTSIHFSREQSIFPLAQLMRRNVQRHCIPDRAFLHPNSLHHPWLAGHAKYSRRSEQSVRLAQRFFEASHLSSESLPFVCKLPHYLPVVSGSFPLAFLNINPSISPIRYLKKAEGRVSRIPTLPRVQKTKQASNRGGRAAKSPSF